MWHWNESKSDNLNQLKTVLLLHSTGEHFLTEKKREAEVCWRPKFQQSHTCPGTMLAPGAVQGGPWGVGPRPSIGWGGWGKRDRLQCRRG